MTRSYSWFVGGQVRCPHDGCYRVAAIAYTNGADVRLFSSYDEVNVFAMEIRNSTADELVALTALDQTAVDRDARHEFPDRSTGHHSTKRRPARPVQWCEQPDVHRWYLADVDIERIRTSHTRLNIRGRKGNRPGSADSLA
jgi:hypothetical protein